MIRFVMFNCCTYYLIIAIFDAGNQTRLTQLRAFFLLLMGLKTLSTISAMSFPLVFQILEY